MTINHKIATALYGIVLILVATAAILIYNNNVEKYNVEKEANWTKQYIEVYDGNLLVFKSPQNKNIHFSAPVVYDIPDGVPEDEDLDNIRIINSKEIQLEDMVVKTYNFITSTNYKWSIAEIPLDDDLHIELGYSYKNQENDMLSSQEWDRLIQSIYLIKIRNTEDEYQQYTIVDDGIWFNSGAMGGPVQRFFEVDIDTFEIMYIPYSDVGHDNKIYYNEYYSKDKNHVFYAGQILQDADPETFEVIIFRNKFIGNKFIGIDDNHVYQSTRILEGLSPDSLQFEAGTLGGSILYDDDTQWYYKANCNGGGFVSEEEIFKELNERYNSDGREWTRERYLEEYSFC